VDKYKAQLVAKGYFKVEGIDFDDISFVGNTRG